MRQHQSTVCFVNIGKMITVIILQQSESRNQVFFTRKYRQISTKAQLREPFIISYIGTNPLLDSKKGG